MIIMRLCTTYFSDPIIACYLLHGPLQEHVFKWLHVLYFLFLLKHSSLTINMIWQLVALFLLSFPFPIPNEAVEIQHQYNVTPVVLTSDGGSRISGI